MSNFPNQVERVIREGYNFNFGDYISRGFDIAKKATGMFAGFFLLLMVINWVFDLLQREFGLVGSFTGLLFTLVISPCLMAGFYYTARKVDENQYFEFSDFFKGFDWVGKIFTLSIIESIATLICLSPLLLFGYMNFESILSGDYTQSISQILNGSLFVFAGVLPLVYLSVGWMFAPFLIVFYDMEAWPAMEASRKIITKQWFLYFFFIIIVAIISILGILGLIIALLFTIPAGICMIYAAFQDIVGMPGEEEEDDILDHLIESV